MSDSFWWPIKIYCICVFPSLTLNFCAKYVILYFYEDCHMMTIEQCDREKQNINTFFISFCWQCVKSDLYNKCTQFRCFGGDTFSIHFVQQQQQKKPTHFISRFHLRIELNLLWSGLSRQAFYDFVLECIAFLFINFQPNRTTNNANDVCHCF